MNILRTAYAVFLLGVVCTSACGSSSSSKSDAVALCKQNCAKTFDLCLADAGVGGFGSSIKTMCETACTANETTKPATSCTNSSAVLAAVKACQAETTCEDFTGCLAAVPKCEGSGTGTGGASGTGGATAAGTGGSSGVGTGGATGAGTGGASGGGTTCADLSVCCGKITDAFTKQLCTMQLSTVQSRVTAGDITQAAADGACAQVLTIGKSTYCP